MAAGDSKVTITKVGFLQGEPVKGIAEWKQAIESKSGDIVVKDGSVSFQLAATRGELKGLSGQDIEDAALAAVNAQKGKAVPTADSVTIG